MRYRADAWVLVSAFLAVALGGGPAGRGEPLRYDAHRIVRVEVRTPQQLDAIEALGGNILNCTPGVGPMDVLIERARLGELEALGLAPQTIQDDVQGMVDRQRAAPEAAVAAGDPFADFFLSYHPYDGATGIVWYLNELASRYPTLVSVVNVGTTLLGQPIWGVRVTSGLAANKPAVLYFGCEHAREWIACTHPAYVATHLVENYGLDPAITDLVDNVEFFLVPVFNVDGYLYSWSTDRFWRKNRRGTYGVDLNRNWAEGWGGEGSSGATSSQLYRGTAPFSEPETQALRDFILSHPNIRALLDVHSYGELILWPNGYTISLCPDDPYYREVGLDMQSLIYDVHGVLYDPGPVYTTIYPAAGVSVDWAYAQRDILSFSYEARDTGAYGFILPAAQILPNNEELLPATLRLSNAQWVRSPVRVEFPSGLPSGLPAGFDTLIPVRIVDQTQSALPASARLHYRYGPGAFTEVALSWLGGEDYEAVLPATNCFASPEFYFSVQTTEGSTARSPPASVPEEYYVANVYNSLSNFYVQNLDSNPGWSRTGAWAFGQPAGAGGTEGGGPDPTSGHTGNFVYGYNLFGDYTDYMAEQHLTSPAINCTNRSNVHLRFWRWLGVDSPLSDHASVRISDDGSWWTTVWENSSAVADTAWAYQDLDISAWADHRPAVYLRWTIGTTDASVAYCGWNVDDVALDAGVCNGLRGDANADGLVNAEDFEALAVCFSGSGSAYAPGCRVFDFEEDGDVDCLDAAAFRDAWTGVGLPPTPAACVTADAPQVWAEGSRYLGITPPAGELPMAIVVTAPARPCWTAYADFDANAALAALQVARLVDQPVYRTAEEWGSLHLADRDIVPSTAYRVAVAFEDQQQSSAADVVTVLWGDTVSPYGFVDALDITGVVNRFKSLPGSPPVVRCDVFPARPDHGVNAMDIVMVVDAFKGFAYSLGWPDPCPP